MCRILWIFLLYLGSSNCYRLPTDVLPNHYNLEILTNLNDDDNDIHKFEFIGKVWIEVKCVNPTSKIVLHSTHLDIKEKDVKVKGVSDKAKDSVEVEKISYDKDNDFLEIALAKPLKKDEEYEIYIPYNGTLKEDLSGYYKSSYIDEASKEKKWIATTQFEATYARKAFPCFDEPAMKATFNITLGRKEKYTAISNMPLLHSEPIEKKPGWYWDRFEKSVPMSTYLIAFIISDFDYRTSDPMANNVTFKVWARKDAINQVEYAKKVGPLFLHFFETFFGIKYPLPKQDMIAIPDFASGAMENWGLITYRESRLLYDPKVTALSGKESIANVIAHELAHQWFGNLVTMNWWSDLWLNEGFATFMSSLASDEIHPEWNAMVNDGVSNVLSVFTLDALETSHPIIIPIGHPKMIEEIFDTITYEKGSAVLHMMYHFLGKETLRKGVSSYLEKHKYKNAEQDDLWAALTEEAHKANSLPQNLTVKTVMDSWTLQTGYPLLTVKKLDGKDAVEIKQSRHISSEGKLTKSRPNCWWVPLSYTTEDESDFNSTKPKTWLSCPADSHVVNGVGNKDKWYIFNIQMAGLYRVNYDENNWKLLIKALNSDSFDKIAFPNRVQLIDDSAHLAWNGDLDYCVFFDIIKFLKQENNYLVFSTALSNLAKIDTFFQRTSAFGLLRKFMRKILEPVYKKNGGFDEPAKDIHSDQLKFKRLINSWACAYEVEDCINDARKLFAAYRQNPEKNLIPKDYRNVVYKTGIKFGGEADWEFLWNEYKKANVAYEKVTILIALSRTREIWLLQRYLEWSLDENHIRKQDCSTVFTSVAGSELGYNVAKDFFYTRLDDIHKYVAPRFKIYGKYLSPIALQITTERDFDEFKNFVMKNNAYFTDAKQGVEQATEKAKINVEWHKKHYDSVKALLEKY